MKDRRVDAEFVARMNDAAKALACPECGAVGHIAVTEKWYPVRGGGPEPTRGPRGFPLWSQCGACGSGGRVAQVSKGYHG